MAYLILAVMLEAKTLPWHKRYLTMMLIGTLIISTVVIFPLAQSHATTSEMLGGLWLTQVYDHGPLFAAATMIAVDFGIICWLMLLEGIPSWERKHYQTFLWNDTIFIPLYMGMVVVILQKGVPAGFYTQAWWHWLLLVGGFAGSILAEVREVRRGHYTMSEELSPSKFYHTFIFGIVAYWLMSTLIPVAIVLWTKQLWVEGGIVGVAMVGFFFNFYRDIQNPPKPHLEGTYIPWEWHRRI